MIKNKITYQWDWDATKRNLLEEDKEVAPLSLIRSLFVAFNSVGKHGVIETTPEHLVCLVVEVLRSRNLSVPSKEALETLTLDDLFDELIGPVSKTAAEDC